ncbi:MAG: hypothetical protein ACRDPZ_11570 [Gaiellaceae bacterium]
MRSLDEFLPAYEFSERHRIAIDASPARIYTAVRSVCMADIPVGRALWWARRLGRRTGDPTKPFVTAFPGVVLEDVPGEGVVLGLTGQFWRLRGNLDPAGPRTAEHFLTYSRPDVGKAVIDLRVGPSSLSTETRVHVADPVARQKFHRYWLVIRPFSGLIRILLLRAARRRAEATP